MPEVAEQWITDVFFDLFIFALVVRKKTEIYRRRERENTERDRMYAVCKFVDALCEEEKARAVVDRDYLHFLLRIRATVAPGSIGAFDDFYHEFVRRMSTGVNLNFPFCDSYSITSDRTYAASRLEHATPRMRALAEKAADVYVAEPQ